MDDKKPYGDLNNEERLQYLYKRLQEIVEECKDLNKQHDELEIEYEHLTETRKKNFHSMSLEKSKKSLDEGKKILEKKHNIQRLISNRKTEKFNLEQKLNREERVKAEQEEINKFYNWIDSFKSKGYTGVVNLSEFDFYFHSVSTYANICDERDDLRKVNTNQYRIIFDDNEEVKTDFEIKEPNELFYKNDERFKNKKSLVEFLDKSNKVYVNKDMCFIPYTYKQDNHFYLIVINNIIQNIEDYQLKSLNFLNKQHNIYYIIETNRDDRFKDLNELKNYILKTCQKYVNPNRDLLYSVYPKLDNFKKDKGIVRQY